MKRWHQDEKIARREWRKHRRMHVQQKLDWNPNGVGQDPFVVDCKCDDQIGRFRKKDAYDCGRAGCMVCASHKFPYRQKTERELFYDKDFQQQLKDL